MFVRALPIVAGIAPLVAVHLAYWLGVTNDVLPACMPYLDGCTSISATGRYMPGSLLFRAVMLPQSVVLVFLWYFAAYWLAHLAPSSKAPKIILYSGLAGAIALILYVTFLGTKAPFYEFMRRFGIYFYFLGTAVAQVALASALLNHAVRMSLQKLQRYALAMLGFCGLPFALGILNLILKAFMDDANFMENRIEWISALLMQFYFIVVYLAWRDTGFIIEAHTN